MQRVENLDNYRRIQNSIGSKIEKCIEDYPNIDEYTDPVSLSIALREKARMSREIAQDLRNYSRMLKRA